MYIYITVEIAEGGINDCTLVCLFVSMGALYGLRDIKHEKLGQFAILRIYMSGGKQYVATVNPEAIVLF